MTHVGRKSRHALWAVIAVSGIGLAGCAPTVTRHGHHFQDNDIQQVQTGMSSGQVMGLLGSPTTTATVGGSQTLYYISSTEKQTAFFAPEETERKVLAVYFTPLGAVERVSQYGLKDGKVINFSANQTPNSARDENVIKQLFRKLGTKQLFGADQ
jgi:outer membrane protein assembly factor BamE (lipoprotein component of BamABCDE complex)